MRAELSAEATGPDRPAGSASRDSVAPSEEPEKAWGLNRNEKAPAKSFGERFFAEVFCNWDSYRLDQKRQTKVASTGKPLSNSFRRRGVALRSPVVGRHDRTLL